MHRPAADLIVIDTLGKLYAHGYGLTGYCRNARCRWRPSFMGNRGSFGFPNPPPSRRGLDSDFSIHLFRSRATGMFRG
jgi:hypothetical protein